MDNNISNKLSALGFEIEKQPEKVDSSKVNLQTKIEKAKTYINRANMAVNKIDDAPDKEVSSMYIDSAIRNYQKLCEATKDILLTICKHQNINLSDKESFSEAIRKTNNILGLSKELSDTANTLLIRNDAVHDYLNEALYEQKIVNYIVNYYTNYVKFIDTIENFCNTHKLI